MDMIELRVCIDVLHFLPQSKWSCFIHYSVHKETKQNHFLVYIEAFILFDKPFLFHYFPLPLPLAGKQKPLPDLYSPAPISMLLYQSSPESTSVVPLSHHIHTAT